MTTDTPAQFCNFSSEGVFGLLPGKTSPMRAFVRCLPVWILTCELLNIKKDMSVERQQSKVAPL